MANVPFAEAIARAQGEPVSLAYERRLAVGLMVQDAFTLTLAFALAGILRFANPWLPYHGPFSVDYYVRLVVWVIPIYLVVIALNRLYDVHGLFGGVREYQKVVTSCTFGVIVIIVYSFLDRSGDVTVSRGWLLAAWLMTIAMMGGGRFAFRRWVYRLRRRGQLLAPALILGTNEEAQAVAEGLRGNPTSGIRVLGFVGQRYPRGTAISGDLCVLGQDRDLPRLIQELNIHEVLVAPTAVSRERLLDVHATLANMGDVHLRLSSGLFEIVTTGVQVQDVGNVPLISLNRLRITGLEAFLKTCMDYGLTIPGLIVFSPLLLALAVLVKRSSPGPIIHRRRVMGMGGRAFDAYKFRTMVTDADQVLADMLAKDPVLKQEYEAGQKLKDDPRVTPLGRTLRRFSLDELPQVFNVLKNEMSLVGPRMITPDEIGRYGKWATNLLTVKPGMTGPWQVMGRNDIPYDERVRLSMNYIRNYSIWTDARILMQTFLVVVRGKGAY